MSYTFTYLSKEIIDPSIAGTLPNDKTIVIEFKCEGFIYYARCLNGIIQYTSGERAESYNNWTNPPTQQQIIDHDLRREEFNADPTELQAWINSIIDSI
jgi:hypothetical protein